MCTVESKNIDFFRYYLAVNISSIDGWNLCDPEKECLGEIDAWKVEEVEKLHPDDGTVLIVKWDIHNVAVIENEAVWPVWLYAWVVESH